MRGRLFGAAVQAAVQCFSAAGLQFKGNRVGGCDVGRWLEFKNLVPANQVSTLDRSVAALPIPTAASHTPAVEGRSWEGLVPDCRGSSKGKQQQWFPECGKLGTLVLGPEGF